MVFYVKVNRDPDVKIWTLFPQAVSGSVHASATDSFVRREGGLPARFGHGQLDIILMSSLRMSDREFQQQ